MTIFELKKYGKQELSKNNIDDIDIKINCLLKFVLRLDSNQIILKLSENVSEENEMQFKKYINELIKGVPLQYITNNQEFMGMNFYVDENVLIPRPDTEILVEEVIKESKIKQKKLQILDMCTGSGAIAISLAKYIENCTVIAVDISESALKIARKNAKINKVSEKIEFIKSNMFEKIKDRKFDILVSNPPYIETNVIENLNKDVKNEPIIALDGGRDGLEFYREIANNVKNVLNENGILFLEIGYNQKNTVKEIFKKCNIFKTIECKKDYSNNDRVIIAKR